jgi:hypothetical protein
MSTTQHPAYPLLRHLARHYSDWHMTNELDAVLAAGDPETRRIVEKHDPATAGTRVEPPKLRGESSSVHARSVHVRSGPRGPGSRPLPRVQCTVRAQASRRANVLRPLPWASVERNRRGVLTARGLVADPLMGEIYYSWGCGRLRLHAVDATGG